MNFHLEKSKNQSLSFPFDSSITLSIKREDRIDDYVSGNKYRKLKYNLDEARKKGFTTLLTYGGAYSNHIAAVAKAGRLFGFKTIGVIRGEELITKVDQNPTLSYAKANGMMFDFVTRTDFKFKTTQGFQNKLRAKHGHFYNVPEGGTNELAVLGCQEILNEEDAQFDYVCCAVGTGGTISGLINSAQPHQKIIGFPALKGDFLSEDISKFATSNNWHLNLDYHFGGYGKINEDLIAFINQFKIENNVPLDPIYTGKMMYGIFDLVQKGYFKDQSKILAIHTGGLQGISGMNSVLTKKRMPLIL
ncbi:MAG: 1-aminocyclopropane-1-carboxylate deaminase [Bacteroidetes bacterium MedPE-SWsnd-G2]|nr:MAG: 1-aminocyclopropane-1-carboxylate deaminase [Bacteroidetes bacterium MedPE-SWsnd-G2]